jgi:methylmalonyl-CoA mutase N-terminal domain/subunit
MSLKEAYAAWQTKTLKKTLEKFKQRKERFETSSGIELPPIALPNDGLDCPESWVSGNILLRGVRQLYRSRLWTMRQYAGWRFTQETNRHIVISGRESTGLSVAFDLPAQIGYHARSIAAGEMGKLISVPCRIWNNYSDDPLDRFHRDD